MSSIFGFFSGGEQAPAYDPGITVPCPVCLCALARPMVTISLMREGDHRSYFFRAHKHCWEGASDAERSQIEHSLIDAESRQ